MTHQDPQDRNPDQLKPRERFERRGRSLLLSIAAVFCVSTFSVFTTACDSNSLVELDRNELAAANLVPGVHRRSVSLGDNSVLRYTVSVPQSTSGRKPPFVMALHGGGPNAPYVSEGFLTGLMIPGLADLGAIIVAPDIPAASWIDVRSEEIVFEFIETVLDLERSWPIDPERVVIAGYSAGGIGAWFFSERFPDLFSAAIPIAGRPIVGNRRGPDAVPMYIIHGELDVVFDVEEVRSAVRELEAREVSVTLVVKEDFIHTQSYTEPLKDAVTWLEESVW